MTRIIEAFNVKTGVSNPASVKLIGDDDNSPLLQDQTEYLSKCVMLMLLSQRTYPEIHLVTIKLKITYNKVTEANMEKAMRAAEYVYG